MDRRSEVELAGLGTVLEGEILGPEGEAARAKRSKSRSARSLKRIVRSIPGAEDLLAAYYCAVDPQTPPQVRAVLLGALACFVLPFGAMPRVLARFGLVDRISAVAIAVTTVSAHITPAHRAAAKATLAD